MSRLIYGLSGEGRGHTSRALAVAGRLRERGHEVRFCCGGLARRVLEKRGERVIPVPPLEHVLDGNRLQLWRTALEIGPKLAGAPATISRLCGAFRAWGPALLVSDFEFFSARAAERLGVPIVSLNRQQVLTEAKYQTPPGGWLDAVLARVATRFVVPRRPARVLIPTFCDLPLRRPARAALVPPILRPDVRALDPTEGDYVLVYYNHGEGAEAVLSALKAAGQKARVYGFPEDRIPEQDADLRGRSPSREGFLEDLASSRAVICTAGFTLISEALHLGKPVLAVPNGGVFEQALNARLLSRLGRGEWAEQEALGASRIRGFLRRAERYRSPCSGQGGGGTEKAVDHIEDVLSEERSGSPIA